MAMTLSFQLNDDQESRVKKIACESFGHTTETCPETPEQHVDMFAGMMFEKAVVSSEREAAEREARDALQPFFAGQPE